ncbi:MAG: DUF4271 domain-containing protein [Bacteroidales bacterium]|nr:DUF4271 domain-containing protein [Bacteroidales bacterium]
MISGQHTDSATAFLPLGGQPAASVTFDASLRMALDSGCSFHPLHTVEDTAHTLQLLPSPGVSAARARDSVLSPMLLVIWMFYLLLLAAHRFRVYPVSGTSVRSLSDRLMPHFFLTERTVTDKTSQWMQFVALCFGGACCMVSFLHGLGYGLPAATALLCFTGYMVLKQIARFLSAGLLDVESCAMAFSKKTRQVGYNLLLWLSPLALVCVLYPSPVIPAVASLPFLVAGIYLLISSITIFSIKMKLYGIFLYFCTLEIAPVAWLLVYCLRS